MYERAVYTFEPRTSLLLTMENSDSEERFLKLEMKLAYQDKLIADLNDVILERGKEVDQLLVRMTAMERLVREGAPENPSNDPPPHY